MTADRERELAERKDRRRAYQAEWMRRRRAAIRANDPAEAERLREQDRERKRRARERAKKTEGKAKWF